MLAIGGLAALAAGSMLNPGAATKSNDNETIPSYLTRPPADEVIYFVLPDRFENASADNDTGGLGGGRLEHGFDPSHKGFYHGGDLAGLTNRLDYIAALGATAIWLGPIYKNKPVQGPAGKESAGYHGYWITDFLSVDPHFGSNTELQQFVDAAHKRDMKVYLDIITNHTADVIAYRECHDPAYEGADKVTGPCRYRDKATYPYTTRGDTAGAEINKGFMGDQAAGQTAANFNKLERTNYAYTPYIPAGEEKAKNPAWLNDPIYYHNRGDTHWTGESSTYGDFAGLDDLFTEHPRVVSGMIEIFKHWISTYKIDGFRIDTARHVQPAFWKAFNSAMISHAKAEGIPNFYIFGEAFHTSATPLARHTRVGGFPYVLDFGFQHAVTDVIAKGKPAMTLKEFFDVDALYTDGEATALNLPVFVGNHDIGRFATLVRDAQPDLDNEAILSRVTAAHAMMYFLRGAPVIYYGSEQGFIGDGNDQAAREDMFASLVDSYNDNNLLGTDATTAGENFDTGHPLFKELKAMADIFHAHKPLRRGRQITRYADDEGGLFAASRLITSDSGAVVGEYLVAFNLSDKPLTRMVEADTRANTWQALVGPCPASSAAPGSFTVDLPAWGYLVCQSNTYEAAAR